MKIHPNTNVLLSEPGGGRVEGRRPRQAIPAAAPAARLSTKSWRTRWCQAAAAWGAWVKSVDAGLAHLHRLYGVPSRTRATQGAIRLRPGAVMRLTKQSKVREIAVERGDVWLTGTPASSDVLLHEGDRLMLTGGWPVVLQALNDAEVTLEA